MVKLVFCLRRKPELSLAEFQRYWRENHAPLVQSHAETLRIRRYVQVHTMDNPANEAFRRGRGGPEGFDGVAELWWDSLDDLMAGGSTDEGRAAGRALLEDERRFIDLANSPLWVAEEHEFVNR